MNRRPRVAAAAASATVLACLTVLPTASASAALAADLPGLTPDTGVASMAPTVLQGDTVYHLAQLEAATPNAAPDPSTTLTLGVMVANRDQAGVAAFSREASTVGSALYHRYLTPSSFESDYGPTPGTVDAVAAWLSGGGLSVYRQAATPGYLTASGDVAQIGALMDTGFTQFTSGTLAGVIANTADPTVPAAVMGVAGLNTGTHPTTPHPIRSTRAGAAPVSAQLLTPQDLWDIYQQPAADLGQGQGLALFGEGSTYDSTQPAPYPTVEGDLRQFEHEYGFPAIPYTLDYYRSTPGEAVSDDGGYGEWTLDAQAAQGMAPDATELVDYFGATGSDPDVIGAYDQWVMDPDGPLQGSTSFGNCEDVPGGATLQSLPVAPSYVYLGNPNQDMYATVFEDATAMGKTLFSASGDTGQCPVSVASLNGVTLTPSQIQDYPGVDPSVVGVGGTVISYSGGHTSANGVETGTTAVRTDEDPWNFSGGGESLFIAAPPEQTAAVQPVSPAGTAYPAGTPAVPIDPAITLVDHHGNAQPLGTVARIQPDVAALSGNVAGNGYTICSDNACNQFGAGTSLASPLWLGMWARIQAAAPANGQGQFDGLGFALPVIYDLAKPSVYLQDYFDPGNEAETPPSNPSSNGSVVDDPAAGGYDALTGWGTPDLTTFITEADGNATATPTDPGAPVNPPPTLPETPVAVLVPIAGGLVAWRLAVARRRRRRA